MNKYTNYEFIELPDYKTIISFSNPFDTSWNYIVKNETYFKADAHEISFEILKYQKNNRNFVDFRRDYELSNSNDLSYECLKNNWYCDNNKLIDAYIKFKNEYTIKDNKKLYELFNEPQSQYLPDILETYFYIKWIKFPTELQIYVTNARFIDSVDGNHVEMVIECDDMCFYSIKYTY